MLSSPTKGAKGGKKRCWPSAADEEWYLQWQYTAVNSIQRRVLFSLLLFIPARWNCHFLPPSASFVGLDGTASVYALRVCVCVCVCVCHMCITALCGGGVHVMEVRAVCKCHSI